MSIREEVETELDALDVRSTAPGLTAVALALAGELEDTATGTAASNVARELRMALAELRKLAPVRAHGDTLDEIAKKREARRRDAS